MLTIPVALGGAPRIAAQTSAPEAAVSFSAGFSLPGAFWHLPAQPTLAGTNVIVYDTFDITRRFTGGASLWVGVMRYVRPWLGVGVEGAWIYSGTATACGMRGPVTPDTLQLNLRTCEALDGQRRGTSALAFQATVTGRAFSRSHTSPFVRAAAGFALLGHGFVETRAPIRTDRCSVCAVTVLEAPRRLAAWSAAIAMGVTFGTGPGGRFRVEARDAVLWLPEVQGPANPLLEHPVPPTRSRAFHRPTLAFGVDAVLGGPRRRRY